MSFNVSVVVSTFNRLPLLQELLDALGRQTLGVDRFAVIVVDDGSKVPVEPVLSQRKDLYPLRVITQKNAGAAAARDAGIRQAKHDIIVVTDDDMLVPPDFLEKHVEKHALGHTLVLGHIAWDDSLTDKPLFERFHAQQLARFVARYRTHPTDVRGVMVCTGNVSFRRDVYEKLGGFDRSLDRSEDRELGVRMQKAGAKLYFAYDAVTTNRSDHTDLAKWRRSNFNYGVYDSRIHKKHPDVVDADPWHFIFLVNPVSRGLLMLSASAPAVGDALAEAAYKAEQALDERRALHPAFEKLALAGVTLSYGLDYFRGVREEAGSLRATAWDFVNHARRHLKKERR